MNTLCNGKHVAADKKQAVYIIGAKGFTYGGYETFLDKLTEYHQTNDNIQYYIACKANGSGYTDETKLSGVKKISDTEYIYHNAHCFKIYIPEKLGPAQAIYYDCKAFSWCLNHIKENKIDQPIVYVLACRIGPFFSSYVNKLHKLGGRVFINPDGHEWKRAKWSKPVRTYWKESEKMMVKNSDLIICDSINIEKYIKESYGVDNTTFIAYGAETRKSIGAEDRYQKWLEEKQLRNGQFCLVVGRFVPENNYETMIREFMKSKSTKDFALITNVDDRFLNELESRTGFRKDKRIKFVGTVYDQELLMKIREQAYGYFHGHEVGGTNPSLLEALGSTELNLLLDVGFNREVGEDAALYWSKEEGDLSTLIDNADIMSKEKRLDFGKKAKSRIKEAYSWELISDKYKDVWLR